MLQRLMKLNCFASSCAVWSSSLLCSCFAPRKLPAPSRLLLACEAKNIRSEIFPCFHKSTQKFLRKTGGGGRANMRKSIRLQHRSTMSMTSSILETLCALLELNQTSSGGENYGIVLAEALLLLFTSYDPSSAI